MNSYIVCIRLDGGKGTIYWTGYSKTTFGATFEALNTIDFSGVVSWVATNPRILFDIDIIEEE